MVRREIRNYLHLPRGCTGSSIRLCVPCEEPVQRRAVQRPAALPGEPLRGPYARFRQKLKSTCEMDGIRFDDTHDEAYTSQVDALAFDPIKKPPYGRTRRISRGLYRSAEGTLINADVNGALNHVRRVAGDSVVPRIVGSGRVNRPVRIKTAFEPSTFAQSPDPGCKPPRLGSGS